MGLAPRTIRTEFVVFAACLFIPLLGLIGYGLYDRTRDEFAAAERVALGIAEAGADRITEYIDGSRTTLGALAKRPLVKAMDAARCDPRLGDLADLYPRTASFTVVDPNGLIICSSRALPPGQTMHLTDQELLREMRARPRLLFHKPVRSRISGRWVTGAVHPVMRDDGSFAGSVALATDLSTWDPYPAREGVPAPALISIVAGDGTVIGQSEDAELWIGRRIWDESLLQRVAAGRQGVVRARGPNGIDRIYGFKQVAEAQWYVLAGLPADSVVFAPARQRLAETAIVVALIVALVLLLAGWFVARITRPIRAIATGLGERAEGRGSAPVPEGGPREVLHMARELNRMIDSAERARRALAEQAERLRIMHEIDRAIIAGARPEAIAAAVLPPLRELLGAHRAIVNLFDAATGEVEWLAAAGRHRTHVGPGVRFSSRFLGDVEGLRRGERQRIETRALPPGPEADALLASGVHFYIAVPMLAAGELIGALSFGGEQREFSAEQIAIAEEVAAQVAIAITQARLLERVQRQAEELEQRVRERTAELEAANRELESFSYSVSHDLRAPVRAVDGFARMLEEDHAQQLDAEGLRLLGVVRDSSRRMGQLIDDLLTFSRFGRQEVARRTVDMDSLLRDAIAEVQPAAPIEASALPAAHADRALLKQVWLNLLQNALKYSSKRRDARIEVGGRREGGESVYWVRDNGVGFDMRFASRLFGIFQRLHGQDEFPGTGVGLAIVQRVVARHGGRVWAEGKIGEGACFFFTLPVEAER